MQHFRLSPWWSDFHVDTLVVDFGNILFTQLYTVTSDSSFSFGIFYFCKNIWVANTRVNSMVTIRSQVSSDLPAYWHWQKWNCRLRASSADVYG